jgi:ATP synthase protein I
MIRRDRNSREAAKIAADRQRRRQAEFHHDMKKRAQRKRQARREADDSFWYGLRLFGMVGWSVAVPILLGIALGLWLDSWLEMFFSWTLLLLIIGAGVGCFNAWYWIQQESRDD